MMGLTKALIFLHLLTGVYTANLLFIPIPLHSHVACFTAIADELIARGHTITFVMNEASAIVEKVTNGVACVLASSQQ